MARRTANFSTMKMKGNKKNIAHHFAKFNDSDFLATTTPQQPHSRGRCRGWLKGSVRSGLEKTFGSPAKSWFPSDPSAEGGTRHVRNRFQTCMKETHSSISNHSKRTYTCAFVTADKASPSSSNFSSGLGLCWYIAWKIIYYFKIVQHKRVRICLVHTFHLASVCSNPIDLVASRHRRCHHHNPQNPLACKITNSSMHPTCCIHHRRTLLKNELAKIF